MAIAANKSNPADRPRKDGSIAPMIAIRAHPVKPRVVIYVKPKTIDKLATKLAEMERIVLVKTELEEKEIVTILKKFN